MPFNELTLLLYLIGSIAFCWVAVFMLTVDRPVKKIEFRKTRIQPILIIALIVFLFAAGEGLHLLLPLSYWRLKELPDLAFAGLTIVVVCVSAFALGEGPASAGLSLQRAESAVFFLVPPAALMFLPGHFVNLELLRRGIGPAVVAGAIAEELFFRGYMQTRLESLLGDTRGLLVTAAVYAVFRLPMMWGALPPAGLIANLAGSFLIWGCAAGLIYRRTGNIYGLVLLHIFWDTALRVFLGLGVG